MYLCWEYQDRLFVCALLYNKTFKRFEPEEDTGDGEWSSDSIEETDRTESIK